MILLDTCAVIWDALGADKLTPTAKKAIEGFGSELIICDISIWEISILIERKRLVIDDTASGFIDLLLQARNFHVQGITPEIAELSVNLEPPVLQLLILMTREISSTLNDNPTLSSRSSTFIQSVSSPARGGCIASLITHTRSNTRSTRQPPPD
uniref:PIN domain nuclease, a component of toxin-antitoxin system (PIN domain) n=1 Tax=Candidatus Kentrum sp. LFY TaxID=2126342 RepID=A0A450WJK4_9GAMM|nr:MAG: PIN domain nuclease, a component of toxin-antitoxin system (PIN domain) [Candidatus Kentron sp. LFY]